VGQALVDDLPADRLAVVDGGEAVAEPRRVGTVAAEAALLDPAVGVAQHDPVPRRLHDREGGGLGRVDRLYEPESPFEPEDLTGLQGSTVVYGWLRSVPARVWATTP
jgi:hypothetical protein